jgi:hypothetical protein
MVLHHLLLFDSRPMALRHMLLFNPRPKPGSEAGFPIAVPARGV